MDKAELIDLARRKAQEYKVPEHVFCGLIEQESSWDTWAVRYEPAFYNRYIQPLVEKGVVKTETEARGRAFSYGLGQVMGQVAREFGFTGKWLTELCNPEVGLQYSAFVLSRKIMAAKGIISDGLLRYNGGGDPDYPNKVMTRAVKYQQTAGVGLVEE